MSTLKLIAICAAASCSLSTLSTSVEAQVSTRQIESWASDDDVSGISYGLKHLFLNSNPNSRAAQFKQMLQNAGPSAASGILHQPFEKGRKDVERMYLAKGYQFEFQNSQPNFYNQMSLLSGMASINGSAGSNSFSLEEGKELEKLEGRSSKSPLQIKVIDSMDTAEHYSSEAAKAAEEAAFAHPFLFDRSSDEALAESVAKLNSFFESQGVSSETASVDESGTLHLKAATSSVYKSILPEIFEDQLNEMEQKASKQLNRDISNEAKWSGSIDLVSRAIYNSNLPIIPESNHHVVIELANGKFEIASHPSELTDEQIKNAKAMYMSSEAINDFVARTQGQDAPAMSDDQLFKYYNDVITMTGASPRISSAADEVESMIHQLTGAECDEA